MPIDKPRQTCYTNSRYAAMAELADALVLGSSVQDVQVQVLLAALNILTSKRVFWRLFCCPYHTFNHTSSIVQYFQRDACGGESLYKPDRKCYTGHIK